MKSTQNVSVLAEKFDAFIARVKSEFLADVDTKYNETNNKVGELSKSLLEKERLEREADERITEKLASEKAIVEILEAKEIEEKNLTSDITVLKTEKEQLTTDVGALRTQVANLQAGNAAEAEKVRTIEHKISELTQAKTELEKGIVDLKAETEVLKLEQSTTLGVGEQDITNMNLTIESLKKDIADRTADRTQKEAELTAVVDSINEHTKTLEAKKVELGDLAESVRVKQGEESTLKARLDADMQAHEDEIKADLDQIETDKKLNAETKDFLMTKEKTLGRLKEQLIDFTSKLLGLEGIPDKVTIKSIFSNITKL